jgi:hypothetical protein
MDLWLSAKQKLGRRLLKKHFFCNRHHPAGYYLPDIDGIEVTRRICANGSNEDLV